MLGGDDRVRAVAVALAPLAGKLEGRLVRLGAAVREEDAIERRMVEQQLRQLELRDAVEEVGDLDQLGRLLGERACDDRVGMAEAVDGDTGDQVQVLRPSTSHTRQPWPRSSTTGARRPAK